jgi:hypothetical protein
MAPRYPTRSANPNRVTLDLDPITSDALTDAAKAGKSTRQRLAYELIQRGLGLATSAPIAAQPAEPASDLTFAWQHHTGSNPARR